MALVIALAGGAAFLASFCLLSAGLRVMAARYLLATIVGYLAFLLLIRLGLSWQRRTSNLELDGTPDFPIDIGPGTPDPDPFSGGGGDFGGGGATGGWSGSAPDTVAVQPPQPASGVGDFDLSLDDLGYVLLAGVALLAGAVAIGFVIYTSPVLFAEVLLDAAVVGTIYRRSRGHQPSDWIGSVLGRTILPAVVLLVFMALLGYALQALAPEETSIGGVVRAVVGDR